MQKEYIVCINCTRKTVFVSHEIAFALYTITMYMFSFRSSLSILHSERQENYKFND